MQGLRVEIDDSDIALVLFAERASSVLNAQLQSNLLAAIARVATDVAIRGAVITSEDSTQFIGGADLLELTRSRAHESVQQVYTRCTALSAALQTGNVREAGRLRDQRCRDGSGTGVGAGLPLSGDRKWRARHSWLF
jgi:enoyl-CoA hydratase/carnithine racemase